MKTAFILMTVLFTVAMLVTGCTVPGATPAPGDSAPPPGLPGTAPGPGTLPSSPTGATGTIEVRVTDAPPQYGDIKEIWVKVDEEEGIAVHKATATQEQEQQGGGQQNQEQENQQEQQGEGEWLSIPITGDNPFELLALKEAGVDSLLGWSEIPAGKYTQIRMAVEEVTVVFEGDTAKATDDIEETAKLPSDKLKFVHPFNVVDGGTTIILLDFIADKSVNVTGKGNVVFNPVVKLEVSGDSGTGGDADLELAITGEAVAEWSTEQAHRGKYSVHLETTGAAGNGDEATITCRLPEGTTLGDITAISWWEYLVKGYPPHVDILLDTDGDGSADDALVFEYAYNSEDHYADAPMPYGALTSSWYRTFSDDGDGPAQVDDSANGWLASGPPGPPGDPGFIYGTLAQWKAGAVNGTIDKDTIVLAIQIEVDNWVVQSEAYVDDIAVN